VNNQGERLWNRSNIWLPYASPFVFESGRMPAAYPLGWDAESGWFAV